MVRAVVVLYVYFESTAIVKKIKCYAKLKGVFLRYS